MTYKDSSLGPQNLLSVCERPTSSTLITGPSDLCSHNLQTYEHGTNLQNLLNIMFNVPRNDVFAKL